MDEIRQIPPVTRYLLGSFLVITLSIIGGILDPSIVGFYWPYVTRRFELWRLLTAFCFAGKDIAMVFDLVSFYKTSNSLETETYMMDSAKYGWSIVWIALGIEALNIWIGSWFLFKPLLIGLVHIWALQNATAKVSILGLVSIPAMYYPMVLIFFVFIQSGQLLSPTSGLVAAHAYHTLTKNLPQNRQSGFLVEPPSWWRAAFASRPAVVRTGFGTAMQSDKSRAGGPNQGSSGGGHLWGSGNRLGSL